MDCFLRIYIMKSIENQICRCGSDISYIRENCKIIFCSNLPRERGGRVEVDSSINSGRGSSGRTISSGSLAVEASSLLIFTVK